MRTQRLGSRRVAHHDRTMGMGGTERPDLARREVEGSINRSTGRRRHASTPRPAPVDRAAGDAQPNGSEPSPVEDARRSAALPAAGRPRRAARPRRQQITASCAPPSMPSGGGVAAGGGRSAGGRQSPGDGGSWPAVSAARCHARRSRSSVTAISRSPAGRPGSVAAGPTRTNTARATRSPVTCRTASA